MGGEARPIASNASAPHKGMAIYEGAAMSSLSIGRAWDETRHILARDGRLMTSISLALILVPQALAGVIAPPPNLSGAEPPAWMPLITILVLLAGIIGQIAIIRLALGPAASVGDAINHGMRRVLPALAALILFGAGLALVLTPLFMLIAGTDALQAIVAGRSSPRGGGALLLVMLLIVLISARFQLMLPVATAEPGGPVHVLKRSWAITAGHYWKLLGFIALVLLTAIIVLLTAQLLGGLIARLTLGEVQPFTLSALVVALIAAAAQTVVTTVLSALLARIYAQLAAPVTTVPDVSREG